MEILSKSESLTNLSDSKQYNCLRCAYFATHFTLLSSKISSVFFYEPKIANIFEQMNTIKKQLPSRLEL